MKRLNTEEKSRYRKLIGLEEMGETAQLGLKNSSALVIGAGGLGSGLLPVLCSSGIDSIAVVDSDTVVSSNLQRQTLYTPDQVGIKKIEAAREKLIKHNPSLQLESYDLRLDPSNARELISNFDVVADCTDNFESRYLINDTCAQLRIPLVYGSVSDYRGQVMVLHHEKKADLRDLYPQMPENKGNTKGVLPTLPHIIGAIQANEMLKMLTGKGHLLDGKLLIFDAYSNDIQIIHLK